MNLRELNYFIAVGEAESVTKASLNLRISQPALTRHLKHLEMRVGARLTQRNGRGIALTDLGRQFLGRIKPLIAELQLAETELTNEACPEPLRLSMGLPSSLGRLADRFIERMQTQWPASQLQVVDGWSRFVVDWILSGQLDLGIVYDYNCHNTALELVPLVLEEHFLVGPAGDQYAGRGEISLADAARLPLILPSRPHGLRLAADKHFEALGSPVKPVVELDSIPTIKKLIERGSGYSILSQSEIIFNNATSLEAARIVDPPFLRTLSLAWRRDSAKRKSLLAMSKVMHSEVQSIVDEGLWGRAIGCGNAN
ncbi:LysR family nitrogen assimilation transcriptional regulator [Nitrobacteraceae bacterium AZCC 2146]|jgi:LysR family nitrogen assimilation transcriptional regulator